MVILGRRKTLSPTQEYEVFYLIKEAPEQLRQSTYTLSKKFSNKGLKVDQSTLSRTILRLERLFSERPKEFAKYRAWLKEPTDTIVMKPKQPKYFYKHTRISTGKYNFETEYETVRSFIQRNRSLRTLKARLDLLTKMWKDLGRKDPSDWQYDEVKEQLDEYAQSSMLTAFAMAVAIRNLLPLKFKHQSPIKTDQYKVHPSQVVKTYDLFTDEVNAVLNDPRLHPFERLFHEVHLVLGCREGYTWRKDEPKPGILGMRWDKIDWDKKTVDIYESKSKRGIWWRGCRLNFFGWSHIPKKLGELKGQRYEFRIPVRIKGKIENKNIIVTPSDEYVFGLSPHSMRCIYDHIEQIYEYLWSGKRKFDEITPHTSRHLHVNLMFERGVSLDLIAGDANRGLGHFGVGWTNTETLKVYYLSMVERTVSRYITSALKPKGEFRPE